MLELFVGLDDVLFFFLPFLLWLSAEWRCGSALKFTRGSRAHLRYYTKGRHWRFMVHKTEMQNKCRIGLSCKRPVFIGLIIIRLLDP